MRNNRNIIAALIAAVALAGTAFAQSGKGCDGNGPMGMGSMGGQARPASMKSDPALRADAHLQMLKSALKITAVQEPLWLAFAEKVKGEAGKGMGQMRAQPADAKLPAPERMAQRENQMAERLAAMKGVHESFNRLYAALTPEQQAVADQHVARMGQGMGRPEAGKLRGPGRGMPPAQG